MAAVRLSFAMSVTTTARIPGLAAIACRAATTGFTSGTAGAPPVVCWWVKPGAIRIFGFTPRTAWARLSA